MGRCACCETEGLRISDALGACAGCLAAGKEKALAAARSAHERSRRRFGLPVGPGGDTLAYSAEAASAAKAGRAEPNKVPPTSASPGGSPPPPAPRKASPPVQARCRLCANRCAIGEGGRGFCGLRTCEEGRLVQLAGTREAGLVEWYHDPLPTNCVASWACPAGTDIGYPEYSVSRGPERGWKNLAVFYESCTFDCLFCQNWHFRSVDPRRARRSSAEELAAAVDDRTSCICYFGGDPSSQMPHALAASRIARERALREEGRILRICWETNGYMRRRDLEQAIELSIESGGCVKFDLKCWTESLHVALTGVPNRPVLENFAFAAHSAPERPDVPLVVASTLLVPGYVTAEEVGRIAGFTASLDARIPYSLLAFHPDFVTTDLPVTSRKEAEEALAAARSAGLSNVNVGNVHLLA